MEPYNHTKYGEEIIISKYRISWQDKNVKIYTKSHIHH